MNVLDLFDALHPGPTWKPWRDFVAAVHGEPLDDDGLERFRRHTGRDRPREGGYPEAVIIVGVQSGKTAVAGTMAVHASLTAERGTHAIMVGQDQRGSIRALLRYARDPFERIPAFAQEVQRQTADTLELRGGTTLTAYPCKPHALRGLRASIVCADELGFYVATDGRPTDREMVRVARGRVATTGGKVIVLSSPYGEAGALYDLHCSHYGRDDSDTLVWQASAPDMNPTLPADYVERMQRDDPDAYRSEVLGEFRHGVSTFLDPEALAAVVDEGVRERLPRRETHYVGYVDAASGSGKDSFAIAIAHGDGQRAVLDVCRRWQPPFNPSGAIAGAADTFKRYGIAVVEGDRYAPGFVAEGFRQHRVTYRAAPRNTSENYLELLPLVNAGGVLILDDPQLLKELRGLERRPGQAGRDRVDHRRGQHDDAAVAASGALVLVGASKGYDLRAALGDGNVPWNRPLLPGMGGYGVNPLF